MRKETEQGNKDGELEALHQIRSLSWAEQSKASPGRLLHGNCFTERQEQGLLKTTLKGFQIFDNETALLLEPFPTTI